MPLLLLLLAFIPTVFAQDHVRLASGEWLPYQGEMLQDDGFVTQIVKEAFASEGVSIGLVYLPWKRGYEMTKRGDYDGAFMWRYSEERGEHFLFSEPLIENQAVMFHRKGIDFEWTSGESLLGYVIGGTIGYHYEFSEYPGVEIDWVESDRVNLKKLLHGRVDLFALDKRVGYHMLQKYFAFHEAAQITHTPWYGEPIAYHLLISRKTPNAKQLLSRFDQGLRKLRESGRYAKIMRAADQGAYSTSYASQPHR